MFLSFAGKKPRVGKGVFVDESARVIGDVTLADGVTVLPGAVIRADVTPIEIGEGSVVEDCCVLHGDSEVDGELGLRIGRGVTLGHGAIVHCTGIGDGSLIGMGATVMAGVRIGEGCLVAAGAVVTQCTQIPDGSVVMGVPAKVVRPVSDDLRQYMADAALFYQDWGRRAFAGELQEVEPDQL